MRMSLGILSTACMTNRLPQKISLFAKFGEKKSVGRPHSSSQIRKSGFEMLPA
jgi:hypothetical protein